MRKFVKCYDICIILCRLFEPPPPPPSIENPLHRHLHLLSFFRTPLTSQRNYLFLRDILHSKYYQFDGNFKSGYHKSSIPYTLPSFISYVLHGSSATPGSNEYYNQPMLPLCQLVTFNTLIRYTERFFIIPSFNFLRTSFMCSSCHDDSQ